MPSVCIGIVVTPIRTVAARSKKVSESRRVVEIERLDEMRLI